MHTKMLRDSSFNSCKMSVFVFFYDLADQKKKKKVDE